MCRFMCGLHCGVTHVELKASRGVATLRFLLSSFINCKHYVILGENILTAARQALELSAGRSKGGKMRKRSKEREYEASDVCILCG